MARSALESAAAIVRASPGIVPLGCALAVFLFWAGADGGFDPRHWVPGTILLVGLLVVYGLAAPGGVHASLSLRVALWSLGALTLWSFASMLWAASPSSAWVGSGKTLSYLVVFGLFALRPIRADAAATLAGLYALGIAAVAVGAYVRTTTAADPVDGFIAGRLATPIDYSNANCALFMGAFWPAIWLSGRREVNPLVRGLLLAAAGACAELALMTQSRGSLVAVPAVLVAYFVLVPGRLRSVVSLTAVFVVVALSSRRILAVFDAVVSGEDLRSTLVEARTALFVSIAVLAVFGAAAGLLDATIRLPAWAPRLAGALLLTVVVIGVVGGATALAARYGDPVQQTSDWWESFKSGNYVYEPGTPHLVSGLGSGRYDIWRVAVGMFKEQPLVGAGADNFIRDYTRDRRVLVDPLYPHSIELRMLSQLGLVGAAAALAFVVAAVAYALRGRRRGTTFEQGISAVLLISFVYWLVHGSIDWFWEIPGLAAPAVAWLALSGRVGGVGDGAPLRRRGRALLVAGGICAIAVLTPLWIAERDVAAAVAAWRTSPDVAFDRLERARSVDPWSDRPDVYAATIAGQLGLEETQRFHLRRALERNGDNWYAAVSLAALDGRTGYRTRALAVLDEATSVNPLEPIIELVRTEIRAGRPVGEQELQELFIRRVDLLIGERQR